MLDQNFVQVLDCIFKFELQSILSKIVNESEVSIGRQIFMRGSKIGDFLKISRFY